MSDGTYMAAAASPSPLLSLPGWAWGEAAASGRASAGSDPSVTPANTDDDSGFAGALESRAGGPESPQTGGRPADDKYHNAGPGEAPGQKHSGEIPATSGGRGVKDADG